MTPADVKMAIGVLRGYSCRYNGELYEAETATEMAAKLLRLGLPVEVRVRGARGNPHPYDVVAIAVAGMAHKRWVTVADRESRDGSLFSDHTLAAVVLNDGRLPPPAKPQRVDEWLTPRETLTEIVDRAFPNWSSEVRRSTAAAEPCPEVYSSGETLRTPSMPDYTVMRSKPWGEPLYDESFTAGRRFGKTITALVDVGRSVGLDLSVPTESPQRHGTARPSRSVGRARRTRAVAMTAVTLSDSLARDARDIAVGDCVIVRGVVLEPGQASDITLTLVTGPADGPKLTRVVGGLTIRFSRRPIEFFEADGSSGAMYAGLPAAGSPDLHAALAPEAGTAERVAGKLGLAPHFGVVTCPECGKPAESVERIGKRWTRHSDPLTGDAVRMQHSTPGLVRHADGLDDIADDGECFVPDFDEFAREFAAARGGVQVSGSSNAPAAAGGDPGVRPVDPSTPADHPPAAAPADPEAARMAAALEVQTRCELAREELEAAGTDTSAWSDGDLVAHYDRVIRPREVPRHVRTYDVKNVRISIGGVDLDPSGFTDDVMTTFTKAGR